MYFIMLATSFSIRPATSRTSDRTLFATFLFSIAGIVGWPFSMLASFPFVFEELFILSGDKVHSSAIGKWIANRWIRMTGSVVLSSFIFVSIFLHSLDALICLQIPVILIDSLAYGRFTIVPWNIIEYNIFGGAERGPDLYGSEPWHFYLLNLLLNFNVLVPAALFSIPALFITSFVDPKKLASPPNAERVKPETSSLSTLLLIRLSPFYVWFITLTLQKHKEERFMFPIYPLLCLNAAVALFFARGWMELIYAKWKGPYWVCIPLLGDIQRLINTGCPVFTSPQSYQNIHPFHFGNFHTSNPWVI